MFPVDPKRKNRRPLSLPREVKYAWGGSLTALLSMLLLMEATGQSETYRPVLNSIIDALQQQNCSGSGRAGHIPTSGGTLNTPTRQESSPRAENGSP